jgi:ketosteroid isomerase-like protein
MMAEQGASSTQVQVRDLIECYIVAIREHDIDRIMSCYAPDLVAFDLVPPLQYSGAEAFRKVWENVFEAFERPIPYELRDLCITAGDDVAFSHSLNHNGGTMRDGRKVDLWLRWTACFRKIDGKWRIAHLQASVPVDIGRGRAAVDAKP